MIWSDTLFEKPSSSSFTTKLLSTGVAGVFLFARMDRAVFDDMLRMARWTARHLFSSHHCMQGILLTCPTTVVLLVRSGSPPNA